MSGQPPCDGCLGSRACWVCLGQGVIEPRRGRVDACHRCFGTGKCPWCQEVRIKDLGRPEGLTP